MCLRGVEITGTIRNLSQLVTLAHYAWKPVRLKKLVSLSNIANGFFALHTYNPLHIVHNM